MTEFSEKTSLKTKKWFLEMGYKIYKPRLIMARTVFVKVQWVVQCNLDLVTLLVSAKTVTKLHNVTKSNDFMK